ncbi:MAG: AMP-binding protein, partial [Pseudomonadales bacterium]
MLARRIQDPTCVNRIAIDDGESKISYPELGSLLSRLARKLDEIGVQPGQTVALATERNMDAVIALLALVWHGNVYLPIDKSLPAKAIADLMEECGAKTLLCSPHEQDRLAELSTGFTIA